MDFSWIWKTLLILAGGVLLLRISGRRSIAQMTFPQTVIMLAIGTLLIGPVSGKNIWITLATAILLIGSLIFLEYIQMKSDFLEKILTGKAKMIIENGTLNQSKLKELRLSVDKLEMRLRQKGIEKISDVKWATIEPSGELGYILKEEKEPATKEDINKLTDAIEQLTFHFNTISSSQPNNQTNLFTEIIHNDNIPTPPKHLQ